MPKFDTMCINWYSLLQVDWCHFCSAVVMDGMTVTCFDVTGMTCQSCIDKIEQTVRATPGVASVKVRKLESVLCLTKWPGLRLQDCMSNFLKRL